MEAIVFSSTAAGATRIRSADDLEAEFVAEPLVVSSPRVFALLAQAAGLEEIAALIPLRDATCQSFPVWILARALSESLAELSEDQMENLIERWREGLGDEALDADPYELSIWIAEIQAAWQESERADEQLFVLFEEKAMLV